VLGEAPLPAVEPEDREAARRPLLAERAAGAGADVVGLRLAEVGGLVDDGLPAVAPGLTADLFAGGLDEDVRRGGDAVRLVRLYGVQGSEPEHVHQKATATGFLLIATENVIEVKPPVVTVTARR
jgi:hypothetical protein